MGVDILKDLPGLVGSLSSASAAVIVTIFFLRYLRETDSEKTNLLTRFTNYHSESQKKFQDQLETLYVRQEESQEKFQDSIAKLTTQQNDIIKETIFALKEMKYTVKSLESIVSKVIQIEVKRVRKFEEGGKIIEIEDEGKFLGSS